jgi:hypothetical protein
VPVLTDVWTADRVVFAVLVGCVLLLALVVLLNGATQARLGARVRELERQVGLCGWMVRDQWGQFEGRCGLPAGHPPRDCRVTPSHAR